MRYPIQANPTPHLNEKSILFGKRSNSIWKVAKSYLALGWMGGWLCLNTTTAMAGVREEFITPPAGYGEVPFWWWTGEKLDKERIAWQLRELAAAGVSGTQVNYSHLRSGNWRTHPVEPEIFSAEWWDVFTFAAEESARLGMGIGLSCYTLDWPGANNLFRRLGITTDQLRAHILTAKPDAKAPYGLAITPVVKPNTLDPLNPESAQRVIKRFFNKFLSYVPANAHKALNYFFQDELRLAGDERLWCDDFAKEFRKRKGYDIMPYLAALFKDIGPNTTMVRLDYNDVMTQLESERYFKPIYDWHASRGMIYACDPATRGRNPIEFGDYMRAMKWYTAPGFDTPGTSADIIKNKMGSSIAHLYNRPRTWLEGYHSQGWQASTCSIFDSTVHNFVYGASLLNLHGLYYSTLGGWWEWAPPCYHFRMPYWQHMPHTLKYFERLSYLLTRGKHVADVAVLTPLEPVVADAQRGIVSTRLAHQLVTKLVQDESIDCDFIDGDSLVCAKITKDLGDVVLSISGEKYRVLALPGMFAMREESRKKVEAFRAAGGKVIAVDAPSDIEKVVSAATAKRDFTGPKGTKVLHRQTKDHDFYYLVDLNKPAVCSFRAQGRAELWDPWTGAMYTITNGTSSIRIEGRKGVPQLIVFARDAVAPAPLSVPGETVKTITLDDEWDFTLKPTLDNKWGDFRLPAGGIIGAELRRMTLNGQRVTLGYGTQFMMNECEPFAFSWKYGVEDKPAYQDQHHGLNGNFSAGRDFFILGPYVRRMGHTMYDVQPKDTTPPVTTFTSFVYAPTSTMVRIVSHGTAPHGNNGKEIGPAPQPTQIVVGDKQCATNELIKLNAGFTPIKICYQAYGRASVTFVPIGGNEPLRFDPFGGKQNKLKLSGMIPGACNKLTGQLHGEITSAKVGGAAAQVVRNGLGFTITPSAINATPQQLELEINTANGYAGAHAFETFIACECGTGRMKLGDWAKIDALECYSGGATYSTSFTLKPNEITPHITLDLGAVGVSAGVSINGSRELVRTCPPWEFDLTPHIRAGTNTLAITIYNTLNNHYQTIPTCYRVPTANAPSGLLGPVKILLRK